MIPSGSYGLPTTANFDSSGNINFIWNAFWFEDIDSSDGNNNNNPDIKFRVECDGSSKESSVLEVLKGEGDVQDCTKYVSVSGKGNECIETYTCNLSYAISKATFGDIIVLEDGDYGVLNIPGSEYIEGFNNHLENDFKWITIKAKNSRKVIFNNTDSSDALFTGSWNQKRLLGYKFEGIKFLGEVANVYSKGLYYNDCEFIGNSEDISQAYGGIGLTGCSDITVNNSIITHSRINGISGSCNYLSILNSEISDVGSDQIQMSSSSNLLIENNHIHSTNFYNKEAHPDVIMLWYGLFENVTIRNNIIHDGAVQGVYLTGVNFNASNVLIENNLIYNIETTGLAVDNTRGGIIRNNTLLSGTKFTSNSSDLQVYNNLITSYYSKSDDFFSYRDYNIYRIGAGGSGWYNVGRDEKHSYAFPYGTTIEGMNIFVNSSNYDYRPKIDSLVCNGSLWSPAGVKAAGKFDCNSGDYLTSL